MSADEDLRIVNAWVAAANRCDPDGVVELSAPDIAIVGPRGDATGHKALRDWLSRAGVQFETEETYINDAAIVLQQRAVWRNARTAEVVSEATVATMFHVSDGKVDQVRRYDYVDVALAESGLTEADRYLD